jgi:hypothetical protein
VDEKIVGLEEKPKQIDGINIGGVNSLMAEVCIKACHNLTGSVILIPLLSWCYRADKRRSDYY